MIREDLFKDCINSYQNYKEWEDSLADLGINFWENEHLQNFISTFFNLLNYCCNDEVKPEEPYNMPATEFFVFETDFGKLPNKVLTDGVIMNSIYNVDELWEYITKVHPEIVDKNKLE